MAALSCQQADDRKNRKRNQRQSPVQGVRMASVAMVDGMMKGIPQVGDRTPERNGLYKKDNG